MSTAATLERALPILREKRAQTLRARCALVGVCMHFTVDDHGAEAYLLTRGPRTREFGSLDEVEAALAEVGAL